MLRYASMLGLLLAMGCGGKSDDAAGGDEGNGSADDGGGGSGSGSGSGDDTCGTPTAEMTSPATNSDVYYRTTISFAFSKDTDEDATVSLAGPEGDISGSQEWLGDTVVFTPDTTLAFDTDYTATLTHCGGEGSMDFRTGTLGAPLDDEPTSLENRSYAVDLNAANFVKPEGVGSLLGSLLTQNILIGVVTADESEITMMGALSEEGSTRQDVCSATFDFPIAADFTTAPYFSVSSEALKIAISGFEISINDFTLSGDFSADGKQMGGAVLAGQIDARDLSGVLVDSGLITEDNPDEVCGLVSAFGVACEECADSEKYCLSILVNDIYADETGTPLVPLTEEEADACGA